MPMPRLFCFALLARAIAFRLITIPLDKQYVPVLRDEVTVAYKTAYFGKIFLGTPRQSFSVIFDTGSGHFFLPSSTCNSTVCRRHRRFDRRASATSTDINHDGAVVQENASERDQVAIAYGTGEVTGEFVRETVCLGDAGCASMRVVLATEMTQEPFSMFEFDGVLGLGLDSLAVDPEFSFFEQLSRQSPGFEARFGYFVSKNDEMPSEISFGGHDSRRVAHDLQWSPVHRPDQGYWQVKIVSVSVAGEPLPFCQAGDCVAIADTGTSLLGVPRLVAQRLHWLLARKVPDEDELDCRDFPGPELVFELEGGVKLTLGPEDYSRPAAMKVVAKSQRTQVVCRATLLPVDEGALGPKAWILGEPVLKKYYSAYDWTQQQVGFALAVQPTKADSSHRVFGKALQTPAAVVHV